MQWKKVIEQPESDCLDFKKQWHDDTANLILDILCLANSDTKSDRYLVIGYDEKTKEFGDISINRKSKDDFHNILSTAGFNRVPNIQLETANLSGNEIDIIIIKQSNYRPYFLLKDKPKKHKEKEEEKEKGQKSTKKEKIVRAGVIYTRNGSVNTPINESASENQIADMWRERFGLTLSPKERLNLYAKDYKNWKYTSNSDDNYINIWHYEPFPEFTIEYYSPENMRDYSDPPEHAHYRFAHSIGNSYETNIRYKYHTTILQTESLFICDKQRYFILQPHCDWLYYNPDDLTDIHVFTNSSQTSDREKTIREIDAHGIEQNGNHNQLCFFYNIIDSFEYYVQKILKNENYDIYSDYIYFDNSQREGEENENIHCPNKILLLDQNEEIATRLKAEFLQLQQRS